MTVNTMNRVVPRSVVLRLFLSGTRNQISWLVLGIGMCLGWVVIFNVDLSFVYYRGTIELVTGTITDSSETNMSINEESVVVNSYRFITADGRSFEDFSYATGRWHSKGNKVTIEYPKGKPHLSRIQGMRRKLFGTYGILFAIVPAVGVGLLYFSMRKALKIKHLLQDGRLTTGTLVDKEETNVSINDDPVYKLTFAFTADDGREHHVVHRTHKTEALEDESEERLLYGPSHPEVALMVDALPSLPDFDERGNIRHQPVSPASFILPVLTLGGHGIYALSVLL